jgi:glycopeptide antibiotics resistance protein
MGRSPIHAVTLIILSSIISVTIQFGLYYFLGISVLTFVFSGFLILICSHIFLELTISYESIFSYTLLNTLVCLIIIGLSFFNEGTSFINFHPLLLLFVILNIFLPIIYGILRTLLDNGQKYINFKSFYYNCCYLCIVIYIGIIVNLLFLNNSNYIIYYSDFGKINFIPFLTLATLIEDYMGGFMSLASIANYLLIGIIIYVPYGFFISLFLRKQRKIVKFLYLFMLPLSIEVLQLILLLGKCDIDDIILGVIGGIIGTFLYYLQNLIFRFVKDEDFLSQRSRYSFYRNDLHF